VGRCNYQEQDGQVVQETLGLSGDL